MFNFLIITISSIKLLNSEEVDNRSYLDKVVDFLLRKDHQKTYSYSLFVRPNDFQVVKESLEVGQLYRDTDYNHYMLTEIVHTGFYITTLENHTEQPTIKDVLIRI